MTDDTLREECENLMVALGPMPPSKMVDTLLTFARAQQAKGMRKAASIIDGELYRGAFIENALHAVEAQATARDLAPVPYPGWCRQPAQCQGKVSCPLDPTCAD